MIARNLKSGILQKLFKANTDRRSRVVRRKSQLTNTMIAAERLENRELLTADSVTEWNEVLLDAIRVERPAPPVASRAMAIVHTAIFDAVNSIDRNYEPYLVQVAGGAGASLDAAVASAAQRTLVALFPARQADFDAALASSLAAIPDGPAETTGIEIGNSVADQILALRSTDGASTVVAYTPGVNPGEWRPTPAGFAPAVLPQWPDVTPFALTSGSQFRPVAPPALTSAEYAADLAQVQELGSSTSATRTADQTDIAKFWAGGPGTATPPGEWNMIAQTVTQTQVTTTAENARLFALLNVALADAAITAWDAKYEYNLWRPITAIREADSDGNAATVQDAAWTPLLNTPAFPSYTSGHSTFSSAAAAVLANFFGNDDMPFVQQSEAAGVANRSFTSFSEAAAEAGISRIYGGIHYNFDNTQALSSGDSIGDFVTDTLMRPVTRINTGGPELSEGLYFATDRAFQNGVGIPYRTAAPIDMSGVSAELPSQLFQSVLWDNWGGPELQFSIPTTIGATYRVDLLFSEIWGGAFRTNARTFDVNIEGLLRLDDLDIFAEAGANKALLKSFEVTSDGVLNIDLLHGIQNPAIAGIVITELSAPTDDNNAPTISDVADQTINENTATASLGFTVADADGDPLIVTATSSNPALLPVGNIVISGTGSNRTVMATPVANGFGTAVVTLQVSDGQAIATDQFLLTVNEVIIPNTPPTISDVADQTIDENTSTASLPFTVTDLDGDPLTVTATSSNPALLPVGNIVISGTGSNRTVRATPVANSFGTAIVTLQVSDGQDIDTDQFTVTVNDIITVNLPPTISAIADQTMNGGTTNSLPFTVADPENGPLTVTAAATDPSVLTSVTVAGAGNNRTLNLIAGTALGESDVTVTVSDGTFSTSETFRVTASLRLNSGGPLIAGSPDFIPDAPFRNVGSSFSTSATINSPVAIPPAPPIIPSAVYQTVAFDWAGGPEMEYNIPLEAGADYRVDLLFSEIWSGAFRVGARVFDVKLDGDLKLDNLDIFAEAGANNSLVKSFEISSDGNLDIDLFHVVENPAIAGIQITRLAGGGGALTSIASISPTDGDEMISLTRETIVMFDSAVDPSTVTDASLYLIAKGSTIPASIRVSSTGTSATVFYDNPLPESTEIRVVVDGDKIKNASGEFLDGDGDGSAGGIATADFRTLPLTLIPGTRVFGYIYDSYNRNPDGSDIPVVGATIFLDANPNIRAVTDATGFFEMGLQDLNGDGTADGLPSPEFFVHIDGSTAINAPAGATYATLGKPFHSVPGQRVQLRMDGSPVDADPLTPGDQFDIYLPPMAMGDIVPLLPGIDTTVGFGPSVLSDARLAELFPDLTPAERALLSEMKVTYPAGSAMNEDGTMATQAMVIPVNPERLPAPLPGGVDPKLVISIQAGTAAGFNLAGGSTNFDVPAPVTFPNLEGLLPGEKSLIWSFDHDAGMWTVIGTGTVSADGRSIVSDAGVGVLAPGWHFTVSGTQARWKIGERSDTGWGDGTDFEFADYSTGGKSLPFYKSVLVTPSRLSFDTELIATLSGGIGLLAPGLGPTMVDRFVRGSQSQFFHDVGGDLSNRVQNSATFAEVLSSIETQINVQFQRQADQGFVDNRYIFVPVDNISFDWGKDGGFLKAVLGGTQGAELYMEQFDVPEATLFVDPVNGGGFGFYGAKLRFVIHDDFGVDEDDIYDNPVRDPLGSLRAFWVLQHERSVGTTKYRPFVNTVFVDVDITGQFVIPDEYRTFERRISNGFLAGAISAPVDARPSGVNSVSNPASIPVSMHPGTGGNAAIYYSFSAAGAADVRGRFVSNIIPSNIVLSPNRTYSGHLYQPSTNLSAVISFQSSASGSPSLFSESILGDGLSNSVVSLNNLGGPDSDADGLPDVGEWAMGTNANDGDSDGDGILDFQEITQGLNPLDNTGFPTGVISSLPMPGSAEGVAVANDLVYIATGSHGLAVIDGAKFDNPILLGQIDLNGTATDVSVDAARQLAAVATGLAVQIVDVSDPMLPALARTVTTAAAFIEVVDGFAYAAGGTTLSVIDLVSGDIVQKVTIPGSGQLTGFAREGARLYAYLSGSDTVSVIDISKADQPTVLGQKSVSIASSDVGLFVGNEMIWLAGSGLRAIDASDPANMQVVGQPQGGNDFFTARRVALNGSGLALVAPDGGNTLALYDSSDAAMTGADRFLTSYELSGDARDVAISRGIAYVAAGGRLEVINYRPFDTQGQAPTATLITQTTDLDLVAPGIQILEGSRIPVRVATSDDVQVRQVELLLNGQVVQTDVSFPFDAVLTAPLIAAGGTTLRLQARVTDTGGNSTLSAESTFTVSPDIFPPVVESTTPAANAQVREGKRILRVRMNEPIDVARVTASGVVRVVGAGPDGLFGSADDVPVAVTVEVRDDGRLIQVTTDTLVPSLHELRINQAELVDAAGNVAGSGDFSSRFDVAAVTPRLVGNPPTAAFVIDVSGSTGSGLGATGIGDRNGDGSQDTILDAEIAGFEILNQELINLGFGSTAQVSIIPFDNAAQNLDMDPVAPGLQLTTTPLADANGNGVRDVEEVLRSLRTAGGTSFEQPWQRVVSTFATLGVANGTGNVFFISDGNGGGGFTDEVELIRNQNHGIVAFAAGTGASLGLLQQMDPGAARFTSTDELLDLFLQAADGAANPFAAAGSAFTADPINDGSIDALFAEPDILTL